MPGKRRIHPVTARSGHAAIQHSDRNEVARIAAATLPTGNAAVEYHDHEQRKWIMVGTGGKNEAAITLADRAGEPTWNEASE